MPNRLPLASRATGLRGRIALAVVLSVLSVGLAAMAAIQFTLVPALHDAEDAHALTICRQVAVGSEDAVLREDAIEVRRLMDQAMLAEPELVYLFAVDAQGAVIVSTFADGPPAALVQANVPGDGAEHSSRHIETDRGLVFDVAVPMFGGRIGTMHAGLSEAHVRGTTATERWVLGGITLLVAALGVSLAYVAGRVITRPIEVLVDTAVEVRDGDLTKRAAVSADPEIGLLAESFNTMVDRLEEDILRRTAAEQALTSSADELRQLNETLELRVDERTRQLAGSNEELASANQALTAANEELFETIARLEEANRLLGEATSAKSRFLASMSHELRTPLNSIIGFSGVLLQGLAGPLSGEQENQIAMIHSSGRRLLALINDVLDLTKVEAGHLVPHIRTFDVVRLAREALESVRPLAEDKGLKLLLVTEVQCSEMRSDPERVMQVLVNLLGNAVKFTLVGMVTLTVTCVDDEIRLAVTDTGAGVAPEELDAIFLEFYQIEDRDRGKPAGTGLGLPVSRRIAEVLHGTLTVRSELGHGSTFTLALPIDWTPATTGSPLPTRRP